MSSFITKHLATSILYTAVASYSPISSQNIFLNFHASIDCNHTNVYMCSSVSPENNVTVDDSESKHTLSNIHITFYVKGLYISNNKALAETEQFILQYY